jgi:hypothetical protein
MLKIGEAIEEIFEKFGPLNLLLPKNFSRISPFVYIFWGSLVILILTFLVIDYLWLLTILSGFIFFVFVLFFYFWKWPLI